MPTARRQIRGSKNFTSDSFMNFAASLGYGASNLSSGGSYGFNPLSRNHVSLEYAYRGSWIVKAIVDIVAEDMIREGISIESDMPPDDMDKLMRYMDNLLIWQRLTSTIKWARLYGGCVAVMMVDGQKTETPLNIDSISLNQFRGLLVLDRWMLWPSLENPVMDLGADYGMPKFYEVVSDAKAVPHMKVHHSRCIRMDGVELPYWQRIAENNWGLSVIEPIYDRLLAFDSTTQGAAQLVYRAHLRTLKIEKLRELIAFGGPGYSAVQQQIAMIRLMQSNEGLTVLDSSDEFDTHQYAFGGLSDVINQFAQQLSGAAQIPLTKLFAQAPAGLNATGDSDIRNYYDAINSQQESRLRRPLTTLLDVCHRSCFGKPLPEGFDFSFNPLWQMTDQEKAETSLNIVNSVSKAVEDAIITPVIALKELRQSSKVTGIFSNITDEDITDAENAPPPIQEGAGMPGEGAGAGASLPGLPGTQQAPGEPTAPEHPPAAATKPVGGQTGAKEEEADDSIDYRAMLPPFTKAHVAAMYAHMRDEKTVHGITVDAAPDMDENALIGPDADSTAVWMIEQRDPDTQAFDDYRYLLSFTTRDEAIDAYKRTTDRADDRIASVRRMNIAGLREFIGELHNDTPKYLNGGAS